MANPLVDRLRAAHPDISAREIAEVLWLAQHLGGSASAVAARPDEPGPPALDGPAPDPVPGTPAEPVGRAGRRGPGASPGPAPPAPAEPTPAPQRTGGVAEVRLPPAMGLLHERLGAPMRLPSVPALPQALELGRAMRPLRMNHPSRVRRELDERRTAEQIASTRVVLPAFGWSPERRLRMAFVIDTGTSMWMWQDTVAEFAVLLRRLGAFRQVRVWQVDSGRGGPIRFASGGGGLPALLHRPEAILDPAGDTAVVLFSDCVGTAWADGRLPAALAPLAARAPIAVIHPLPPRLWDRCAVATTPVEFRSRAPVTPTGRLEIRPLEPPAIVRPPGVAIPLLEFSPRALGAWAELVGEGDRQRLRTAAFFSNWSGPVPTDLPRPAPAEERALVVQLLSAPARQLATYLAAAPLRQPVMRLLHQIALPAAPPTALAEVFASGIVQLRPGQELVAPADLEYTMPPDVRDVLLSNLTRGERQQIVRAVFAFFQAREGSPLDFLAFFSAPELAGGPDAPVLARVNAEYLRDLGGHYADAVRDWERRVAIARATVGADRDGGAPDDAPALDVASPPQPSRGDNGGSSVPSAGGDVTEPIQAQTTGNRPRNTPSVWGRIPARNPHFAGRRDLLQELHEQLRLAATTVLPNALHGLGGVGKTQLAVEYAHRFAHEYDLVWWVPADSLATIRDSLVALAEELGISTADHGRAIRQALEALRVRQPYARWLVVFDNADDIDAVVDYLPHPTGHLLITSRDTRWESRGPVLVVDVFSREESRAMLQQRAVRRGRTMSETDADALAAELGDLPLALEQAAAWQEETGMSATEYLELFRSHRADLLQESGSPHYATPVAVAWGLSMRRLQTESPVAAQLVEVLAFFGPDPISVDMLGRGLGSTGEGIPSPLRDSLRDPLLRGKVVREVGRYALAKVDPVNRAIVIHRLVGHVIRDGIDPLRRREVQRAAQRLLINANPGHPERSENWARYLQLASHVLPTGLLDTDEPEARQLLLQQIRFRYSRGEYETSRELAEKVCETWERRLGEPDNWHADKLLADRYRANALRALGFSDEARRLNARTFELCGRLLGPDHEYTCAVALSVGADLRAQGRFELARTHDEANLAKIRERQSSGISRLNLARALNNLAIDHRLLYDFRTAYQLDEEALQVHGGTPGGLNQFDHEVIANIVRDLYGLGEYEEALRRQDDSIDAHRNLVGVENPQYLLALRNRAILLRKLGDYPRSRAIAEDNLTKHHGRFGPNHEHTLSTQMTLCNTLRVTGECAEAVQIGEQALARYQEHFLSGHQFTLICAMNLAIAVRLAGQPGPARERNEQIIAELRAARIAEDHPLLLCSRHNLAGDLAALGRHEEALQHSGDVARLMTQRFGSHPYALGAQYNQALDLIAVGRAEEGLALRERADRGLQESFYPDHPELSRIRAGHRFDLDLEPPPL